MYKQLQMQDVRGRHLNVLLKPLMVPNSLSQHLHSTTSGLVLGCLCGVTLQHVVIRRRAKRAYVQSKREHVELVAAMLVAAERSI